MDSYKRLLLDFVKRHADRDFLACGGSSAFAMFPNRDDILFVNQRSSRAHLSFQDWMNEWVVPVAGGLDGVSLCTTDDDIRVPLLSVCDVAYTTEEAERIRDNFDEVTERDERNVAAEEIHPNASVSPPFVERVDDDEMEEEDEEEGGDTVPDIAAEDIGLV